MKLLYTRTSPFARKVRVLAHELALAEAPELVARNPLAQVPSSIRDHGAALYDSPVICE
jgi:glutathione S-transferase